jgi:hypothetical protein
MPDYYKLLVNLEENIFHLIQKRDYHWDLNFRLNTKTKSDTTEIKYDKHYILNNINVQLEFSEAIIELYLEKFPNTINIDIDIINLIVKYISICGKILKEDLQDTYGVRELSYLPSSTIVYLSVDYIINKYKGKYGWGITEKMILDLKYIFLNIVIPFSEKYMFQIYKI